MARGAFDKAPLWLPIAGTTCLLLLQAESAAASQPVESVGTARIASTASVRIFENANSQLELSQEGLAFSVARGSTLSVRQDQWNFMFLPGPTEASKSRKAKATHRSGAGSNFANEALSVSISSRRDETSKVSGALTLFLANYY
jgi:hypothetical protein